MENNFYEKNNELRRRYQGWRILDHFLGKDIPSKRYISQRNRILNLFLSEKKNEITENNIQKVDRVKNISEKNLKQNYIKKVSLLLWKGGLKIGNV